MAANNILNGTSIVVKTGVSGSETEIAFCTSASLSLSMDTRDISNKSSAGWRELLEAQKSWSVSTEGLMAFRDASGTAVKSYDDLLTALVARTAFSIELTPTALVAGDYRWSGTCFLTSLEQNDPMEDNVTWTATFEGSGALTQTVTV
tara:strand:+ start:756 stop:1199 length:444 start_codon:yes stop_codon:yes gene_type:complete